MIKMIKKSQPIVWIAAIMFAVFFAFGCTDTTDTDAVTTETPVVVDTPAVMPVDSLPPIDTSASSRPIPIKTVQ